MMARRPDDEDSWGVRESGLIAPNDPKPPPKPPRPPLEIQDPEARAKAKRVLAALWRAMGLMQSGQYGIYARMNPDWAIKHDAYEAAFWMLGRMLLGEECPGGEEYT